MMQLGFLCQNLRTGSVKSHRNKHWKFRGWDMNLAPHEHKSESHRMYQLTWYFRKKKLTCKRGFSVFFCWLKRGCLFTGKNTFENEGLREILWCGKNEVSSWEHCMRDRVVLIRHWNLWSYVELCK